MKARTSWATIIPDCCMFMIIIGLFTIWKKIFTILTTKLEITDTLVSGKTGLIHTEKMESPISKITSVKVEQNFFGKIFNYGDVYINTPAGQYNYSCIAEPNKVKDYLINKMQ